MTSTPWDRQHSPGLSVYFIKDDARCAQRLTDYHVRHNYFSRRLRASKMLTEYRLYDEFAAGLQFPYYFGENRAAFDECISDFGEQEVGNGVSVTITDSDLILRDDSAKPFSWFVRSLRTAGEIWGEKIDEKQFWDRDAKPFILTLFSEEDDFPTVKSQWGAYGVDVIEAPTPPSSLYSE
ncbi:barstar family protein [Rathayibacter toxicus]|nr:barstar family protein [Rathayibacter toxicus]QOD09088.1 barstar family protein [Rathayibacter toxicus]QWL25885.1 hypothetical protein E2R32_04425 [Rathayibacter toxicus]QWL30068.1 hypothetical protein E2R34_04420 [Rathayibacter toxicus]QWL32160.1 hypothetical protein E2R35_04430 [Rathayibacter toxicus]QWL34254.1 hypothetical protein E2R36_04435 [Rathayibacter toxicus]